MRMSLCRAFVVAVFFLLPLLAASAAECGEVKVMFTNNLLSDGEDCDLFPLRDFKEKVIGMTCAAVDSLAENAGGNETMVFLNVQVEFAKRIEQYKKTARISTLKQMIKSGWRIKHIERMYAGILSTSACLSLYAKENCTDHIIILEK
jgi:hypothetical protein